MEKFAPGSLSLFGMLPQVMYVLADAWTSPFTFSHFYRQRHYFFREINFTKFFSWNWFQNTLKLLRDSSTIFWLDELSTLRQSKSCSGSSSSIGTTILNIVSGVSYFVTNLRHWFNFKLFSRMEEHRVWKFSSEIFLSSSIKACISSIFRITFSSFCLFSFWLLEDFVSWKGIKNKIIKIRG